jgi:hypothetical protein
LACAQFQKTSGHMDLVAAARGGVVRGLPAKLLQFLRFTLPKDHDDWTHVARVLAWPLWPAEGSLALAASCVFEVYPWTMAWRVVQALWAAQVLAELGTARHTGLAARVRCGELRACMAVHELNKGCATTAVAVAGVGGGFVLSSNGSPKLFVSRDGGCELGLVLARLGDAEGPLALFAVPLRDAGGQLAPGVQCGALGPEEHAGWVRFHDVPLRREALLNRFVDAETKSDSGARKRLAESLSWGHAALLHAAAAGVGLATRAATRFLLAHDWAVERDTSQRALVAAHACLFGLDLLKMLPDDEAAESLPLGIPLAQLRGPLALFACRQGAAHLAALATACGVSGVLQPNALAPLLAQLRWGSAVAGSMAPLARRVARGAAQRFGGVSGAARWLGRRAALALQRFLPMTCDSATLRSAEFQSQALRFRLFVLTGRLLELPRARWSSCDALTDAIGDAYVLLLLLRRFDRLEESAVDARVAATVARCRSLLLLGSWDEPFLAREGFFGPAQLRALEAEREALARESMCEVEALARSSRDSALDALIGTPLGLPGYEQRLFEWAATSKL